MKIELKKFQFFERMSEETTAFVADVFVDGVKVAHAKNDGHGGCTFYQAYEGQGELLAKAEAHCLSLPPVTYPSSIREEKTFSIPMNLEVMIDDLVEEQIKLKEQKKLEKKMETRIMWGKKGGRSYVEVNFKRPLSSIPAIQLQVYIDKYKKEFKEGEEFLNTNLEKLGVKI